MNGWIKMHRSVIDWEWYTDMPTKVLFVHMLLLANTEDKEWKGIVIKRGQFVSSIQKLSEQTGLSFSQVRRCISNLKGKEIIHENKHKYGLFTIVNYNKYQGGADSAEKPKQETKKVKPKKSTPCEYSSEFEQFWSVYPRRVEKAGAFSCWNARIKEKVSPNDMISAAKKYASHCKQNNTEEKFIKHATTFIGSKKPYEDYVVKEKRAEKPKSEEEKPTDFGWKD